MRREKVSAHDFAGLAGHGPGPTPDEPDMTSSGPLWLKGLLLFLLPWLVAASPPKAPKKKAPVEIRIDKGDHTLEVLQGDEVIRSWKVAIGPGGAGPKQFEGDATTPVGTYKVIARYDGMFHKFLHLDYPNAQDRERFARLKREGKVPAGRGIGHSIGIHAVSDPSWNDSHKESDWTLGCIALDTDEVDDLARLAGTGTRVVITD
jgi:murein L,D-transpeptidase YafK